MLPNENNYVYVVFLWADSPVKIIDELQKGVACVPWFVLCGAIVENESEK